MPKDKPQPFVEMRRDNLETPESLTMLATLAVAGLKQYGKAVFVMRPDGGVAFANPTLVNIPVEAVPDLADRPFIHIRPIIGDGKPVYVAWKDGILWEISFVEDRSNT
jgi:hypothetical protein